MKKVILASLAIGLFVGFFNVSHAQNQFIDQFNLVMNTQPSSGDEVLDIVRSIAGYLIFLGGILAGIAIIVAGIMYMAAGSNLTRVSGARAIFKNGVIGALILFAAGLIVNTIILLATSWQTFFS